ncbi:uncharacterized protein LY89DRAFT_215024 [Mollisia scopiformis]|uniref:Uncharacterized protein n=1 Tax=Mollisia scopiformis TaxID=149040 RepID=A0A194WV91_MOLSC|nr:uncharacterized protein LY89DRAFT_215024 [Mollisia scopiformis]KUJ11888.1 hypothetical protein LY89DRAFT_215024 [Mollisia scopiformis]
MVVIKLETTHHINHRPLIHNHHTNTPQSDRKFPSLPPSLRPSTLTGSPQNQKRNRKKRHNIHLYNPNTSDPTHVSGEQAIENNTVS